MQSYVRKQNPVKAFQWDGKDLQPFMDIGLNFGWDKTPDNVGGLIVNSVGYKGKINPGNWVVFGKEYISVYSEKEFDTLYDEGEKEEEDEDENEAD